MIELAGGVEFAQGQRLPAGDDPLGQQPTGRRTLLHAPHAVPTRDIDAVLAHLSYQRTPVGRQRARADPYIVALWPADPVEVPARRIDNGVNHCGRSGSLPGPHNSIMLVTRSLPAPNGVHATQHRAGRSVRKPAAPPAP